VKYRIAITIAVLAVFAYVAMTKDDTVATSSNPAFQAPPTNEPAMKGLQIN